MPDTNDHIYGTIVHERIPTHGLDWVYYRLPSDEAIQQGRYMVTYNRHRKCLELTIISRGPLSERITGIRVSSYLEAEYLFACWAYGDHFKETSEDNYGTDYDYGC